MQNSGVTNAPLTREELTEYEQGWADMMVDIWHEQMAGLHAVDTGRLYASVRGSLKEVGDTSAIEHQFVQYGIYVDEGTGREFGGKRLDKGQLLIKDETYREEHGLNEPRKRGPKWGGGYTSGHAREAKPWFNRKYLYSIYRLREVVQASYGEQYQQMTLKTLHGIFAPVAEDYYNTHDD